MFYNAKNMSIQIEDTTIDYIVFGRGNKNLFIIPGVGDGFKTVKGLAVPFAIMYRIFAKDYKVYVISRRNNLKENFSTKDMALDLLKMMDKLNLDKVSVVGVSQGGMIAQYLGIICPNRVEKLVLVVTASRPNKLMNESINSWIDYAKKDDYKSIMMDNVERSYTGKVLNKNRRLYAFMCKFMKPKDYTRFIIQANSCLEHNTYNELDKITCPTLIIGGRVDKVLGIEGSIELNERIKDSELYIYEEYSHALYEQAKDFNERVYDFLKRQEVNYEK